MLSTDEQEFEPVSLDHKPANPMIKKMAGEGQLPPIDEQSKVQQKFKIKKILNRTENLTGYKD